ncbi:MAG: phosphoribosylformylglycinamidine synthase subunit PurL [Chloroflexi bacterium]|nr:phosphoribosylformylglycinamidine synthase subunit PurL [Chloroflexota bacterium]
MAHRIEVGIKGAAGLQRDAANLGITGVESIHVVDVYRLEGSLSDSDLDRIGRDLLADPITQSYVCNRSLVADEPGLHVVEVAYNPGVMDPVEQSTMKGIADLGIRTVTAVRTAKKYLVRGSLSRQELGMICDRLLANPVVQHIVGEGGEPAAPGSRFAFEPVTVDLLEASDEELMFTSARGQLSLNLEETQAIQSYFRQIGRNPTDVELEVIAQTWSEHCVHKTFKGLIDYDGTVIDNLLKATVMRVTRELNKSWCVSVFVDNAGVIEFDDDYDVCFKVETHNRPSALNPEGGAATGIGGVIRDPLGTGLGAQPMWNTDVFCVGPLELPHEELPAGVLHPKRILVGIHAGVRDYGNPMGLPTVNGAILVDKRYLGNPLVFCGNGGLIPKGKSRKGRVKPGDLVALVGGRTGRDGIHGATFSSAELDEKSQQVSGSAVQIGNPIQEKRVLDAQLQARDKGLYRAVTDYGAGGISCAVGEMGEHCGATVHLERVPLKYAGLSPREIAISESQERMGFGVPKETVAAFLDTFRREDVEATIIGEFTSTGRFRIEYQGQVVADLDMDFLFDGIPQLVRKAHWESPTFPEPDFPEPEDLGPALHAILRSWNVCSKEHFVRQYDHEVRGGSVLKPLVGTENDGPGDAAIVRLRLGSNKGVIIACGLNPKYGCIDPYWMAASAIDEALRQVVAVGGNLERVALLDNFCWGNTSKPDRLAGLVRASLACYDIAKVYETPFISGKDSLNNEFTYAGETIAIPGTLLISALAVMEDVTKAVSMDAKEAGNQIYVVGETFDELGGSHYYDLKSFVGNKVPKVAPAKGKALMERLSRATAQGLVRACHDLSEGGLGVAAAEMAFAGGLGLRLWLDQVPLGEPVSRGDAILFSESNTRFLVEVAPEHCEAFEKTLEGLPAARIGELTAEPAFEVFGAGRREGERVVSTDIYDLKASWQAPFKDW